MKVPRTDLLSILDVAKPALATKDLIESLTCFWFGDGYINAYNDVIGIEIPTELQVPQGGMRGSLLLGLLNNSRAKEISFEEEAKTELIVKAGGAKIKLALLDMEQSCWRFPDVPEKGLFTITPAFLDALGEVMLSVGQDSSVPDQLGVTLVPEDDCINLYTTDARSISWRQITRPKGIKNSRVILPAVFCEQLMRLCKAGGKMYVGDDFVSAENDAGVKLYSRLVYSSRPLNFDRVITESIPAKHDELMIEYPQRLKLAVERALAILAGVPGEPITFSLDAETLRIEAKSAHGEIDDVMRIDSPHDDVQLNIDPTLLKRALPHCDKLLATSKCIVLYGSSGFIHLISSLHTTKA